MAGSARTTTNHDEIRKWVEERGGRPTSVKGTGSENDPGLLRIDFEANGFEENLEEISWDEFFDKFEQKRLAFLFQDETRGGQESRFFKFINRDEIERDEWSDEDFDINQQSPLGQQSFSYESYEERVERSSSEPLYNEAVVECLNDILEEDLEVIDALQNAIERIDDPQIQEELKQFREVHEQQLLEIENLVYGYGGEPKPLQEARS